MSKLRKQSLKKLLLERRKLLQELASLALMIRGSFFQRFSTCSRPTCPCHQGKRHGPRSYVAVTREKSQRQHYVPITQVDAVRKGIGQHQRLLDIVARISAINIELMRGGKLNGQKD